ncbi:ribose 1,5-bisphosphate isomerase [Methanomicrobium sp. W14]|uniref:ribose 1,5-bisphosphate isomerase n=1 Tax=Methanomicrobium sp. W14 TaxID=2817839 RepID=UPI001AE6D009|nr:ribose 1,5-bisphosphate isomerase [Methanomicrobium sp. W14]MBP2133728.1 ribose 1,5-bisphosphate isomerase [Methanomicrobium sp. W14]
MSLADTARKIKNMEIRGAGRIARTCATALKEYSESLKTSDLKTFQKEMESAADILLQTRPTAVSLPNAVNIVMKGVRSAESYEEALNSVRKSAYDFVESSNAAVRRIAEIGARHIRDGDVILTHCNSQAAIACIIEAHRQGKDFEVFATEVRPRKQGLLTIKALSDAGVKTNFIVDSAARFFMKQVTLVIVGSDAVTANGAVVNKIGTSQIALAAHEARTPFIVAAETYKFAPRTITGELIRIEERDSSEVLDKSVSLTLPNVTVRNPAFDVTPADYIDLIITEQGVIPPEMAYIIIKESLGWEISDFDV